MSIKSTEATPWAKIHVDLIGHYTVKTKKLDTKGVPIRLILTAMIFINPSTGWFEIVQAPSVNKTSGRISKLVNQT